MKRRSFIARMFGLPAAAVAVPVAAKLAEGLEQVERKPVVIAEPERIEPARKYKPSYFDFTCASYYSSPSSISSFVSGEHCSYCQTERLSWRITNCPNCGAAY